MAVPPGYFDDPRFRRTFVWADAPDQPLTITYADYGFHNTDENETPAKVLLFFGSMLSSRLVHILQDAVAQKHRVRMLHPDRPGAGGTSAVDPSRVVGVWTAAMAALLAHLGVGHVAVACHSGGTLFALDFVLHHAALLDPTRAYLAIGAPWIAPEHTTSRLMAVTQMLPAGLVGQTDRAVRLFQSRGARAIGAVWGATWGVSQLVKPKANPRGQEPNTEDEDKDARFEEEAWPQLLARIYAEDTSGISSEALLYLRKAGGDHHGWGDWGDYDVLIPRLATALRTANRRLTVDVIYAETDVMIGDAGTKGPLWFDQCWRASDRGGGGGVHGVGSDVNGNGVDASVDGNGNDDGNVGVHNGNDRVIEYHSSVARGADHDHVWDLKWGVVQQVYEKIGKS